MNESKTAASPAKQKHIPVMLAEVLGALETDKNAPAGSRLKNMRIADGTFGNGGYSRAMLNEGAYVLGLDRDPQAVKTGQALEREVNAQAGAPRFVIKETEFSHLDEAASAAGFAPLDAVVLDIGVSSMQIDEGARGFSFQKDGPLDMRMAGKGVSAADVVNQLKSSDLSRIFHFYGEERHASRIARMIEARRAEKPFVTTLDLAHAVEAMGLHRGEKIHAATRIFQALRIYVNDELGELARALLAAERALKPQGRLAVVTFHSLEDRLVKRFFTDRAGGRPASRHLPQTELRRPAFFPLFKGAQAASAAEAAGNPRARSAKLRVGARTDIPPYEADFSIFGLPHLPDLANIAETAR